MTAHCQITYAIPWLPCEQLPYPPEHPRISRMRRRDKLDLPLPSLSYKYFLLRYSSFILPFYSLKPTFFAAALFENFNNSGKYRPQHSSESLILSTSREEMAINFVVPEVNSTPPLFFYHTLVVLLLLCKSFYWVHFFLCFFSIIPTFKPFRNWPIRLWFVPIKPTFSVLVHWET